MAYKKDKVISPLIYVGLLPGDRAKVRFNLDKIDTICKYFIDYYRLTLAEILASQAYKTRTTPIRYWIYFFCYKTGKYSYRELAKAFGIKDYSIISKSVWTLKDDLVVNEVTQKEYLIHLENLEKLFITFEEVKK